MPYKEFQENWKRFSELIEQLSNHSHDQTQPLIKHYIEQNLIILNDIFSISISHLEKLKHTDTANEIICTQARFTNEISKKLSLSNQRFLNASLGHIADYNEWLKAHCDLATD